MDIEDMVREQRREHYANARLSVAIFYECNVKCPHCQLGEACFHPSQKGATVCPQAFKTCPLPLISDAAINIEIAHDQPGGAQVDDEDE